MRRLCTSLGTYRRRTSVLQPSIKSVQRATIQIASECKAKTYVQGSSAAQRERRPQASEKRRDIASLSGHRKVSEKTFNSTFFFSLVCGWCHKHEIGGARYRTRNHLFALDKTSRVTQRHHSLTLQGNRLNRTPLFRIRTYTSAQTTEKAARSTSTPTYISKYKCIDYY